MAMRRCFPILLLSVLFLLPACFEPKEGCLDIAATNFDAQADEDCCCTYPQLLLSVDQVYDTLLFRNDSAYVSDDGHWFRIHSVAFYLSDFQLFQNGAAFQTSDTLRLKTLAGSDTLEQVFTDDFLLVRRSPLEYSVGTFRQDGVFEEVRFRLGLSQEAQKILPNKAPNTHPLATQTDGLWLSNTAGFVFLQAVVSADTAAATLPDTLRFSQADLGLPLVGATGQFSHTTGYDFPLRMRADYKKMFADVNWTTGDITTWKQQIVANLPGVFSVSQ